MVLVPHSAVWDSPQLYPSATQRARYNLVLKSSCNDVVVYVIELLFHAVIFFSLRACSTTAQMNPLSSRATAVTTLQLLIPRSFNAL